MNVQLPVSPEVLNTVSRLDHFRGVWAGGSLIPAERLERLQEAARVQSIAAACRIGGVRITEADVSAALRGEAEPSPETTQILGYQTALVRPFPCDGPIVTTDELRRLHAIIMGAPADSPEPSDWRSEPYHLEFFDEGGTATGRVFQTLPPRLIPETMEDLVTWLELELRSGQHHPVLVISAAILFFVASCPFQNGNGRVAHLMTVHLLKRAGYDYVPYASLERVLEEMREDYFEALDAAETRIWTDEADVLPWMAFYLDALEKHADRVRTKLDLERRATRFSPLQQKIVETVREHGTVAAGLLLQATGANRNTLKDNLRRLVERGVLEKMGERRGTRYRLASGDRPDDQGSGAPPGTPRSPIKFSQV
jgi:Fic family protein